MKAICIADTHSYHRDVILPDGDILIHAGDITLTGSIQEFQDFKIWFDKQPHPYKVLIAGNHDRLLATNPMIGQKLFTNVYYLQDSGIEIEGKQFWGSPWTPAFEGMREGLTFYTNTDDEVKKIWDKVPDKLDVLITHGPPKGFLDKTFDGRSVGDQILLEKVTRVKPKFHIFGHIHEGYGIHEDSLGTSFVNCCVVNPRYDVTNSPIELHL